ncbi:MAG: hypothetical protein A2104_01075 [Candidatus Melainabacteria bacterium GWF2_32_7]|nr:MAG: hypothetical protein A2104_01075 [Candidatus Melainabacteria bacterium GWF2_32_7]
MKKLSTILILIVSFAYVRFYPYITLNSPEIENIYTPIEKILTSSANITDKSEYKIPQTLVTGLITTGTALTGFSLAEVLVALGIVGVVSALVIPGVYIGIREQQYKTSLKKAYKDLTQVTMLIKQKNKNTLSGVFTSPTSLRDEYLSYMNYLKSCDPLATQGECWYSEGAYRLDDGTQYETTGWWFDETEAGAILSNGMNLYFNWSVVFNCANGAAEYPECGRIFVDVNGMKGPNTWGKDIYFFYVYENRLIPSGPLTTDSCEGSEGTGCAGVYLTE